MTPPGLELVDPYSLRRTSRRFGHPTQGDLIWFNRCLLMISRRETFDVLVRSALENPDVSSLQFILDDSQRDRWESTEEPILTEATDETPAIDVYWR